MALRRILTIAGTIEGIDEELKTQVINYVKEKVVEKTVILVTHDKEEAEALSAEYLYLQTFI